VTDRQIRGYVQPIQDRHYDNGKHKTQMDSPWWPLSKTTTRVW
jgi:hypothetical protein